MGYWVLFGGELFLLALTALKTVVVVLCWSINRGGLNVYGWVLDVVDNSSD